MSPTCPCNKVFRPYQDNILRFFLRHCLQKQADKEYLLSSPTGSGKTSIAQAFIQCTISVNKFKRCLAITPQRQIESGFIPIAEKCTLETYLGTVTLNRKEWCTAREQNYNGSAFLKAEETVEKVLVTTHAQVMSWHKDPNFLPDDLTDILLVVDESHKAGENNVLGTGFLKAWKERGGTILYVTATPFRTDGTNVIPHGIRRQIRTLAEHADGIHAPGNLPIRAIPLPLSARNLMQFSGREQATGSMETSCQTIIDLMKSDNWPKSVVNVPAIGSLKWACILESMLTKLGFRVFNAVGSKLKVKTLDSLLQSEREVKDYFDSQVDVIIACKRFDLGTDWPLCSHIYNIGVPKAFNLIIQRWGRAMRLKSHTNYPAEHINTACLTFMVPHVSEEVWDKFEAFSKDHVFLLECFMHDMETAQQYQTCLRWRPEDTNRSRSGRRSTSDEDLLDDIQAELTGMGGEQATSSANRIVLGAEIKLKEMGVASTIHNIIEYATNTLRLPPEEIQKVKDLFGRRLLLTTEEGQSVADRMMDQIKNQTTGGAFVPTAVIQEGLRSAFDEVIAIHENVVVNQAASIMGFVAILTSRTAQAIAEDLKFRLKTPDISVDDIKVAITKYFNKNGKIPLEILGMLPSTLGLALEQSRGQV